MLLGATSLGILILLMITGVPVGLAFIAASVFMIFIGHYDPQFLLPYSFSLMNSMILLALPLFIILGGVAGTGGVTQRLLDFIDVPLSRVRGGLGAAAIFVQGIFGAISGAAAAAIGCIGPIMIPRLANEGYDRPYAASLVAASSCLSLLIPPSGTMIIFAWLSGASVLACFLAGVGPGVLLMTLFIIFNWVMVAKMHSRKDVIPWNTKQVAKKMAWGMRRASLTLVLPILVLGSIYGGVATPTEAAAVAIAYALILSFIYREMTIRSLFSSMLSQGSLIGVIMIMLFCAVTLGRMFAMERIPAMVANSILSLSTNRYVILLFVNVFLIFMGMIMAESTCAMPIIIPLLTPLFTQIGISAEHFATILAINLCMGLITPPMAPMLYTGARIGQVNVAKMLWPSLLIVIFVFLPTVMVTTYFSPLSEWLPVTLLGAENCGFH